MAPKQSLTQTLFKYSSENFTGSSSHCWEGTYGTLSNMKSHLKPVITTKTNSSKP